MSDKVRKDDFDWSGVVPDGDCAPNGAKSGVVRITQDASGPDGVTTREMDVRALQEMVRRSTQPPPPDREDAVFAGESRPQEAASPTATGSDRWPVDDSGMSTSEPTGSTVPAGEPRCGGRDNPPMAAGIPGTPPIVTQHCITLEGMGGAPRAQSTRSVLTLSLVLLLVSLFIGGVAAGANYVINNWWLINPF